MLPDGSDAGMRRLRYTGPGAVLVAVAHERVEGSGPLGRARLALRPPVGEPVSAPVRAQVIALARGVRLRVG